MDQPKLFAVYLGGRAPKANTELHDTVFVTGARIEDTYTQLLDKWFGEPRGLHIDSWLELDVVDGWRVSLTETPSPAAEKLYFVNLGAYDGSFTELHANGFYVTTSPAEAKRRAKTALLRDAETVHKDDLHDVDDCITVDAAGGLHITLTRTGEMSNAKPNNGYQPLPKDVIANWLKR